MSDKKIPPSAADMARMVRELPSAKRCMEEADKDLISALKAFRAGDSDLLREKIDRAQKNVSALLCFDPFILERISQKGKIKPGETSPELLREFRRDLEQEITQPFKEVEKLLATAGADLAFSFAGASVVLAGVQVCCSQLREMRSHLKGWIGLPHIDKQVNQSLSRSRETLKSRMIVFWDDVFQKLTVLEGVDEAGARELKGQVVSMEGLLLMFGLLDEDIQSQLGIPELWPVLAAKPKALVEGLYAEAYQHLIASPVEVEGARVHFFKLDRILSALGALSLEAQAHMGVEGFWQRCRADLWALIEPLFEGAMEIMGQRGSKETIVQTRRCLGRVGGILSAFNLVSKEFRQELGVQELWNRLKDDVQLQLNSLTDWLRTPSAQRGPRPVPYNEYSQQKRETKEEADRRRKQNQAKRTEMGEPGGDRPNKTRGRRHSRRSGCGGQQTSGQ